MYWSGDRIGDLQIGTPKVLSANQMEDIFELNKTYGKAPVRALTRAC